MPEALGIKKFMKTVWYPQPHIMNTGIAFELDDATIDCTTVPLIMQDEGLGAPADLETNPENANFVKSTGPACYPDSRVNDIYGTVTLSLTTKALDENIPAIKCGVMFQKLSFDDEDATDPLSGYTVANILETVDEDTDNQRYPLWNNAKMAEKYTNSALQNATVPGLTTNQKIEGVAFDINTFYDAIHFTTIADKIKSCQRGLKWYVLRHNRPIIHIPIKIDSKVKRMNKKTFFGVMITAPVIDTRYQLLNSTDVTAATPYVYADIQVRYNEWHEKFYNGRT